jgi:hypothetical protein
VPLTCQRGEVVINFGVTIPDFAKPFEMHMDASGFVIGGVLMQEGDLIAFKSKKLAGAQLR